MPNLSKLKKAELVKLCEAYEKSLQIYVSNDMDVWRQGGQESWETPEELTVEMRESVECKLQGGREEFIKKMLGFAYWPS